MKNDNKVSFKETVELFIYKTIPQIREESEIPNCNFIFPQDAYLLFESVKNNPFISRDGWTPNITDTDLDRIKLENNQNKNIPTILVKDTYTFFNTLKEITNSLLRLYNVYGEHFIPRALHILVLKRIWLRMGPNDFNNVEEFLKKQLEFIENDMFDKYKFEEKYTELKEYEVIIKSNLNRTWDESPRNIGFSIKDKEGNIHSLPHIHYGISEDNTCYIYAIQNELKPSKIKKVERLLYHLNEGIEEPKNHPNQVYSLLLFLDLLKSHGITKIKVPTLQVLSYGYHELLSATTKEKFARNWDQDNIDLLNYLTGERLKYKLESYKRDLVWYNKVVEKQDSISKQKTENLINLFYRMECHIQDFIIRNDFDVQGDYLDIIIGNEKSLSK